MSQTVLVVFHGLFMYRFQNNTCQAGFVDGFSGWHVPGIAVYKKNGTGGQWQLTHGPYGPETLQGNTGIVVSKAVPLRVAAKYTNQQAPDWNTLAANDFRWVLDFERDLYGHQMTINEQNFYGAIRLNDGIFCAHARTGAAIRIVDPNNPSNPVHQRKLAALVRANITLNQVGDKVTLQLKQIDPITLPYQQGVDYRIAIKNYEPPGTNLNSNHLGLLTSVLALQQNDIAYQFHAADEYTDMEPGADWIYPNKRPPENCPSATLGISYPILF